MSYWQKYMKEKGYQITPIPTDVSEGTKILVGTILITSFVAPLVVGLAFRTIDHYYRKKYKR